MDALRLQHVLFFGSIVYQTRWRSEKLPVDPEALGGNVDIHTTEYSESCMQGWGVFESSSPQLEPSASRSVY